MDDNLIIELFFSRSEQAVSELDRKYGKLCHKLSFSILNNARDAEECVNGAYLGIWNAIPPHRPDPLTAFLCKIVRNISIMRYHSNTAAKRNSSYEISLEELENSLASKNNVDAEIDEKELIKAIEDFLKTLSKENRVIFMRRYWFSDSYAEIAQQTGVPEKGISVRLTRIRQKLKSYLIKREILL